MKLKAEEFPRGGYDMNEHEHVEHSYTADDIQVLEDRKSVV